MITERDLQEAIAECQGQRRPNANTCLKLASYYTILDHMQEPAAEVSRVAYSYDPPKQEYVSDSEFGQIMQVTETQDALKVIDELMETLRIMEPRLYAATIRKLTAL